MDSLHEEWRTIPGHENHEASNFGRIRSKDRTQTFRCRWGHVVNRRHAGVLFNCYTNADGYYVARLKKRGKQFGVHQLVALTFIGECPVGLVVNHKNGNKKDNRPENLEYVTPSENVSHAHRTGLNNVKGENHPFASIDDATASQLVEFFRGGGTLTAAVARFGVQRRFAERIRRGDSWKHLGGTGYTARRHVRLSEDDRLEIKRLADEGVAQAEIVRVTGVPQTTVSRIMRHAKPA